jgi:hypothetical protein
LEIISEETIERQECRWDSNIKMTLKIVSESAHWIRLAQDTDQWRTTVKTAMDADYIKSYWLPCSMASVSSISTI